MCSLPIWLRARTVDDHRPPDNADALVIIVVSDGEEDREADAVPTLAGGNHEFGYIVEEHGATAEHEGWWFGHVRSRVSMYLRLRITSHESRGSWSGSDRRHLSSAGNRTSVRGCRTPLKSCRRHAS